MPSESHDLPPPVNHVFVDFENVHKLNPDIIGSKTVHFVLMVGAKQTKLDLPVAEKLLQHAATVELIRLHSSGTNALDFTLAYYLGRAVLADPTGYFHIVSKDQGYDPLVEHLRSKHIRARRHDDFTTLTFGLPTSPPVVAPTRVVKVPPAPKNKPPTPVLDETTSRVLQHLRAQPNNRPKRKATLVRHLPSILGNQKTEADVLPLIEALRKAGYLSLDEKGKVTYSL